MTEAHTRYFGQLPAPHNRSQAGGRQDGRDSQPGDEEVLWEGLRHCAEHVTGRRGHGAEEKGRFVWTA